jgi:hypothetical protein
MKKVLLVGCGELGSRFLQAALQVNGINRIDVVELSEKSIEVAKSRMGQVQFDKTTVTVNWHSSVKEAGEGFDLCVIATQADNREKIFDEVFESGVKNILTEKIVTQSLLAYQYILKKSEEYGVNIWVNCKTRAYPVWRYIKSKIGEGEEVLYHSIGGNHGLCTNGIHSLDLFAFLSNSPLFSDRGSHIDPILHTTKRNKYDLSGAFHLQGANNNRCMIDYSLNSVSSVMEIVTTPTYRWMLDHAARQAFESCAEKKWIFEPIPFEGDLSVSNMSKSFIADILNDDCCELPTLQEAYAAHHYLFEVTLPVFNKLLNKQDDICPCT